MRSMRILVTLRLCSILVYVYMLRIRYSILVCVLTECHFECILVSMKHTLILVVTLMLTACAVPKPEPRQLFEQIPNWDGEAVRVCGRTTDRC